jgi:hypothetical protein
VGLALVFIPVASTALPAVGGHDAGVASALITTSQQVGGSLGTALLNTVAAGATTTYLASHHSVPPPLKAALTHGYTQAFLIGAGFLFLAAVVAGVLINIGKAAVRKNDSAPSRDDPASVDDDYYHYDPGLCAARQGLTALRAVARCFWFLAA